MKSKAVQDRDVPRDVLVSGSVAVRRYVRCITSGESESISVMLALQQSPRVMTDDVMLSGVGNLDQQIKDTSYLDHICKQSIRHGYKPKVSDFYNGALAAFPGDPRAFLNHGQGRGHIKDVLESRGMASEGGLVTVKGREPEKDPYAPENRPSLAPDLVEKIRKKRVKQNPDLKHVNQRELREEIVDTHGAK